MSSYQKLFENSTNRFSAVKNIIISQTQLSSNSNINFNVNKNNKKPSISQNKLVIKSCEKQQINQTYQQLKLKHDQLMKNIKQAQQQKQIMSFLFQKIFKIQEGDDQQLKKRFRRKKNDIQNKYQCKQENCDKVYSSSTSLARHMKLKHACQNFQPPQPNYEIPPPPNLSSSQQSQIEKKDQTQSIVKSSSQAQKQFDNFNHSESIQECSNNYQMIILEEEQPC